MFLAKVYVTLKPTVNDPQGKTILWGLRTLGSDTVTDVRAGKYLEITLKVNDRHVAEEAVEEMCRKLLANPVIEIYRYEVEKVSD